MTAPALVAFRADLRLADNAALAAAADRPLVCLFVLDDGPGRRWAPGAAARWWLHRSLEAFGRDLAGRGVRLVLRRGPWPETVARAAAEAGAETVHWHRSWRPDDEADDEELADRLRSLGVVPRRHRGALLHRPEALSPGAGGFYKVFASFHRAFGRTVDVPLPRPAPESLRDGAAGLEGLPLAALELLPRGVDWTGGLAQAWTPGEAGAARRLSALGGLARGYGATRDRPGEEGTSRLSPHLAFGECSPRQAWQAWHAAGAEAPELRRQLVWREFARHVLAYRPDTAEAPFRGAFADFPWKRDAVLLDAWRRGRTGHPVVDAGMRELWETGWMHNRVRMVVASFLTKHLLCPWQEGAAWFWDTLVDADLANNAMGWQWAAGCGTDAAPFVRVFNPTLQGRRFDADGGYVRRWLPELARLPDARLHAPWEASDEELRAAGLTLGADYPRPVVGLDDGRRRALGAWEAFSQRD